MARWVKAPGQGRAGQKVAHVVFGFCTEAAANMFLREGMFMEGKKVYGYKLLSEPICCLKCQAVGHIAGSCQAARDTCAGDHHASECTVADEERACANCKAAKRLHMGHGAADRSCPVFTDKLQFSLERNPAAKYPYFPAVNDPSSWV
ncbi:hypothetical protein B0H17DRAFT_926896, partial [Mycena rosella]